MWNSHAEMILYLTDRTDLSEQEKKILDITTRLCMKDDEVHLIFYNLDMCGDKAGENTEKLLKYILSKGVWIAPGDIWKKSTQICGNYKLPPPKDPSAAPHAFRKHEDALLCVGHALEFGKLDWLANSLPSACKFVSHVTHTEYDDAQSIIRHIYETAANQLEQNIFLDCACATVTKSAPGNRFEAGELCMPIHVDGAVAAFCFVTLEQGYITEIYILTEPYGFEWT